MFVINQNDLSILCTRGDIGVIRVNAYEGDSENKKIFVFKQGDVLRFLVYEAKKPDVVVLKKDVLVESESTEVDIALTRDDTKIGPLISKPTDYWYEVELNPDTMPQTIIGYDERPKIFRLLPEGADK